MSKAGKKPVIAFLGALPPPFGGFTVPLQRLVQRIDETDLEYVVYDLVNRRVVHRNGAVARIGNRAWWLLRYLFTAKEDLICCHYIDWRVRVAVGTIGLLGKRTLISIGGQSLQDSLENRWLRRKIIASSLRRYNAVIAHNEIIRELCLSLGVAPERITIIPNFIPPPVRKDEFDAIPPDVWEFIDSHQPIISANAYALTFYRGQDLYGLDLCVELCANLKSSYPGLGMVFSLPQVGDKKYFDVMRQRIAEMGLESNFKFITGAYQLYPILMKSQVFIRPTNTDGDANSLREALFFKVPSVASDVCPRPEGATIFKNRDIDDLTRQVKDVLQNYEQHRQILDGIALEDNSAKLIKLYSRLIAYGA